MLERLASPARSEGNEQRFELDRGSVVSVVSVVSGYIIQVRKREPLHINKTTHTHTPAEPCTGTVRRVVAAGVHSPLPHQHQQRCRLYRQHRHSCPPSSRASTLLGSTRPLTHPHTSNPTSRPSSGLHHCERLAAVSLPPPKSEWIGNGISR